MSTQESNNIDVLVEVGGIYGDGNVNVTTRKGLVHMVVDYDLNEKDLAQHEYADLESEVSDIRKALLTPAPVDWAKEATRIGEMQDAAKQYMIDVCREGVYVGYYVTDSSTMENVEVRFVQTRDDISVELFDAEIELVHSGCMTPSDWIELAGVVQKAIAGGTEQ